MNAIITPLYDWLETILIAHLTGYHIPAPLTADHEERAQYVECFGAWLADQVEAGLSVPAWVRDWLDMDAIRAALWQWYLRSDDEEAGDLALKYRHHKPDRAMLEEVFNRLAC